MFTLQQAAARPHGAQSVALVCASILCAASPASFADESSELAGDALAPGGVSVGMALAEAGAALSGAGFSRHSDCMYLTGESFAHDGARVLLSTSGDVSCTPGEVVRGIYYEYRGDIGVDAPTFVEKMNERVGAEAACQRASAKLARCAWNVPARFPDVSSIELNLVGTWLKVQTRAIENLGQPRAAATTVDAVFDPMAPIGDLDPLAPGGVSIGMPLAEAHAGLTAAGYKGDGLKRPGFLPCEWRFDRTHEVTVYIRVHAVPASGETVRHPVCKEGSVVQTINYMKTDHRPDNFATAPQPAGMIAAWKKRVHPAGSDDACTQGAGAARSTVARCFWMSPENATGVQSMELKYLWYPDNKMVTADFRVHGIESGQQAAPPLADGAPASSSADDGSEGTVEATGPSKSLACQMATAKATGPMSKGANIGECDCEESGTGMTGWKCKVRWTAL